MALLTYDNLSLSIGDTQILKDINLSLEAGETLALVGESGSGKSMTALAAMQLLPDAAVLTGEVMFDGQRVNGLAEDEMCQIRGASIGMVFQEPMTALNPVKRIGEQIAEGIRFHTGASRPEAEARVVSLMERVGLPVAKYPLSRFPHELSGGQRQRVVIAIALALKPKLLIADEPTTALDVTTQATILDLLKNLVSEDGSALMLISHDLAVVADMVDHIAIMKQGEVVEEGETVHLFDAMTHPYSKKLREASSIKLRREPVLKQRDTLMRVDNLGRYYKLKRKTLFGPRPVLKAVDDVSFEIGRGESLGLVGESGCGKSTLARTLLALNKPSTGQVAFEGHNLHKVSTKELKALRRHMQVVFQDPYGSFNPRHKVHRLVGEPLQLFDHLSHSERMKKVQVALENVGLDADDMDKFPHEFSGGQRQRIAIARAIVTEPSLIIADEPVSALDVSIREQVLELLNDLGERLGISYLFISHDLNVVRAVTDRVLVMYQGRIIEQGPTDDVFDNPRETYTQQLLAATPDLKKTLARRGSVLEG